MRILLLAALGIIVYLKYDAVVRSNAFKSLSHPAKLWHDMVNKVAATPPSIIPGTSLKWSPDSSFLDAECKGVPAATCLESWSAAGREPIGTLRAVMEKAHLQWKAGAEKGFSAKFARLAGPGEPLDGKKPDLQLIRVDLRGSLIAMTLQRPDQYSAFCLMGDIVRSVEDGRCLDERRTQLPFARTRIAIPGMVQDSSEMESGAGNGTENENAQVMRIFSLDGPAVKPVLAGRVVAVPDSLIPNQWVKIYHGENTFSMYRGFSSIRSGILPGAMIGSGDTLGYVAMRGDTTEALEVRIEQDGIPSDPFGFLGIARAEDGL